MIDFMNKNDIIQLKLKGLSNRKIAIELGIDRKTVAKYGKEYEGASKQLEQGVKLTREESEAIVRAIVEKPTYNSKNRLARKYTSEMDEYVNVILQFEEAKNIALGNQHKQKLTNKTIHSMLIDAGFDISYRALCEHLNEKRVKPKEAFIRQQYGFGERIEYDFGEIKLLINGVKTKLYLAVFSSPASGYRWAQLYTNQKKDVFLDSHTRFFEDVQGVYKEVVYDNMRNVVSAFIGKNEKQLNEDLLKMASYYGYIINVTNCFSGNEKGHVERSVQVIRDAAFTKRYRFETLEQAQQHLHMELATLNNATTINQEVQSLLHYRPKYELAKLQNAVVNKYSCIHFENNLYSVPDYLVGKSVQLKVYCNAFMIYANEHLVCEYKKEEGKNKYILKLEHFIDTLRKKPGSIRNSAVLKQNPRIAAIFNTYFNTREKEFIEFIYKNRTLHPDELVRALERYAHNAKSTICVEDDTRAQLKQINKIYNIGEPTCQSRNMH